MPQNYIPLSVLIDAWSRQSGELQQVVLTNLCEQEAQGRFPQGTFRHRHSGGYADPGTLSELTNQIRFSDYDWIRAEASETLSAVMASKSGVLSFCRLTGTRPPRNVIGFWKWLLWRDFHHAAPQPFPSTPEEKAAVNEAAEQERKKLEAYSRAQALAQAKASIKISLLGLEDWLDTLEHKVNSGRVIPWNYHSLDWDDPKTSAQKAINQLSDTSSILVFLDQLRKLEARYETLKSQHEAARKRAEATTGNISKVPFMPTVAAETKAREFLKEQVKAENWQLKEYHFKEARARCGEQLSKRGFDRVWAEIVPTQWRAPGRHPVQHHDNTQKPHTT